MSHTYRRHRDKRTRRMIPGARRDRAEHEKRKKKRSQGRHLGRER